jgi:hypothetical protein
VVVAEQVQRTMDEQLRQLFGQRVTPGLRLAPGGLGRNHDIPSNLRVEAGARALAHGKGEDIGGPIDTAIAGIQPPHPHVSDDEYTQVTALTVEGREQPPQRLSKRPSVDRDGLLAIPTTDGHCCFASAV